MEHWLKQKEHHLKSSILKKQLDYKLNFDDNSPNNLEFFYLEIIKFLKKNDLLSFTIYYEYDGYGSSIELFVADDNSKIWDSKVNGWVYDLFTDEEIRMLKNIAISILESKGHDAYDENSCSANIIFRKNIIEVDYDYYYMAEGNDYSEINLS